MLRCRCSSFLRHTALCRVHRSPRRELAATLCAAIAGMIASFRIGDSASRERGWDREMVRRTVGAPCAGTRVHGENGPNKSRERSRGGRRCGDWRRKDIDRGRRKEEREGHTATKLWNILGFLVFLKVVGMYLEGYCGKLNGEYSLLTGGVTRNITHCQFWKIMAWWCKIWTSKT